MVDLEGKGGGSHIAWEVILLMIYTDINPAQSGSTESSQMAPFCFVYGEDETTKTHTFFRLDTSGQPGHSKEEATILEILEIPVPVYLSQL